MIKQLARVVIATTAIVAAPSAIAGSLDHWTGQGWSVLFQARGDLNRDGREDIAAIVEAPENISKPDNGCDSADDYSDAEARRLIVVIDDGEGQQSIAVDEPRAVLRRDQGGVFGDPLEELSIENGAVVINHYGGSRWRWGNTLRFRLDDGLWRLIGMTDFWHDSISGSRVEYDYNPLSTKLKRTVEFDEELEGKPVCTACLHGVSCPERNGCYAGTRRARPGAEWFNIGPKPNIPLRNFNCWQESIGLLKHLGFQDQR